MKIKWLFTLTMIATLLAACSAQPTPTPSPTAAPVTSAAGNTVNISGFKFDPATITIKVGETVTWINQDTVGHTVVSDDGSWSSKDLAKGDKFIHTFDKAGTVTYKCGVHPSMTGSVVVQ